MSDNRQATHKKRFLKLAVRAAIYGVLSFLLLREATERNEIEECSGVEAPIGTLSRTDYSVIVRYGNSRKAQKHKVVLVTMSPDTEPADVLSRFCDRRFFIARLIRRLNELNVAVIALDMLYARDLCDVQGEETQAMLRAIAESRAVVTSALPTFIIDKRITDGQPICLQRAPSLDMHLPKENSGLVRLDADTRRIPLVWRLYEEDGSVSTAETFALATARAADSEALDTPQLQKAQAAGEQPYSTMVRFSPHSALAVLCGRDSRIDADWRTCTSTQAWPEMNGGTVLIGEHIGDNDKHPAPEGLTYGIDLQANYIAALLDQRYYLPLLSSFEERVFFVTFFVALQLLFWQFENRLWIAALAGAGLWLLVAGGSILLFAFKGYLLTIWLQGINLGMIAISCLDHWVARMD